MLPTRPLHRPHPVSTTRLGKGPPGGSVNGIGRNPRSTMIINDRATDTHHVCCSSSRLLTSTNIATCVAVVRRRCQGTTLASRRSTAHQSHAAGQCTASSSRVPRPARMCRLTDPSSPAELDAFVALRARVPHGYCCAGVRYVWRMDRTQTPTPRLALDIWHACRTQQSI